MTETPRPIFTEKLLIRLPKDLAKTLKHTSRAMGKTASETVRDALRAYLPREK